MGGDVREADERIFADFATSASLTVTHVRFTSAGNTPITEAVIGPGSSVIGMSGGAGGSCASGQSCRSNLDCLSNVCSQDICK